MASKGKTSRGTIREKPNGWEVRYRLKGKQYSHVVHGAHKDAQKWLTAKYAQIDAGDDTEPSRITVQRFLEAIWLREVKRTKSLPMQRCYGQSVRRLVPELGEPRLQALTALLVAQARDALLESGRSPKTVSNDMGALRHALNYAVSMGYVLKNVALAVDMPKVDRVPVQPFTKEQAEALLAAFWASNRSEGNMLAVGLLTGVRTYSELGGMRRTDLDAAKRTLSLGQVLLTDAKGNVYLAPAGNDKHKPRLLELPERAMPFLERQLAWQNVQTRDHGLGWNRQRLLFCNPQGQPIRRSTMYDVFRRCADQAGIEGGSPHTMRHTTASLLLASGVPMKVVQSVLGHSNYRLTADTYAHLQAAAVGDALGAVWGSPDSLTEGTNFREVVTPKG